MNDTVGECLTVARRYIDLAQSTDDRTKIVPMLTAAQSLIGEAIREVGGQDATGSGRVQDHACDR